VIFEGAATSPLLDLHWSAGMSPVFVYALAFLVWLFFACLVWLAAAGLCLAQSTRPLARCLALAMTATFPAVFLYQALAAPIIGAILSAMWLVGKTAGLDSSGMTQSSIVILVSIALALSAFLLMVGTSLFGFVEGWRIGWECGKGGRLRDVVAVGPPARLLRNVLRKVRPGALTCPLRSGLGLLLHCV
jgi:hypothetical protein